MMALVSLPSLLDGPGREGPDGRLPGCNLVQVAYSYGTCRTETRMLDPSDFGRNGPEFGEYGVLYVRHGKAKKGSPPKRRSVLTVWPWTTEVPEQWFTEVRPLFSEDGNPAAWPSERGLGLERAPTTGILIQFRSDAGDGLTEAQLSRYRDAKSSATRRQAGEVRARLAHLSSGNRQGSRQPALICAVRPPGRAAGHHLRPVLCRPASPA